MPASGPRVLAGGVGRARRIDESPGLGVAGMNVRSLLADSIHLPPGLPGDACVHGLAVDSRLVGPGLVFFARPGRRTDGARYVDAALEAGAAAVVVPSGAVRVRHPGIVEVDELLDVIGRAANRFHGVPSANMDVAGITGTNGKTTVTHCVAAAFRAIDPDSPCGVIGTVGYGLPGALEEASLTTPDVLEVHRRLAGMRRAGLTRVAMEVSSHGIEQGRVAGVRFRVACLTNLGRDHLDYHASAENYAAVKRRLFSWPDLEAAVINADDRLGREILESDGGPAHRISYGLEHSDVALHGRFEPPGGSNRTRLEVTFGHARAIVDSPLVGRFNAYNLLAGVAILLAMDVPLERAAEGVAAADPPPGRLQRVRPERPDGSDPAVYVDYAHTPDALHAVLASLRTLARGELRIVFGCGGERDAGKRRLMGRTAAKGADRLFVTSDNPRGEDPMSIIDDILAGTRGARLEVEPDRRLAIDAAVAGAGPEDIVLVAGKGHETWQEIGGERFPFDDTVVVREALARRLARKPT